VVIPYRLSRFPVTGFTGTDVRTLLWCHLRLQGPLSKFAGDHLPDPSLESRAGMECACTLLRLGYEYSRLHSRSIRLYCLSISYTVSILRRSWCTAFTVGAVPTPFWRQHCANIAPLTAWPGLSNLEAAFSSPRPCSCRLGRLR
jgi:hypothetical protein